MAKTNQIPKSVTHRFKSAAALAFVALMAMLSVPGTRAQVPQVPPDSYVCFPTCATTDGRFVVLSNDPTSFVAQTLNFSVYAAPGASSFKVGVFDGDADIGIGANWDVGTAPHLTFSLFIDPDGNGDGAVLANQVGTWTTSTTAFANNGWTELDASGFSTSSLALKTGCSSACPFVYLLRVTVSDTSTGQNVFKVRTNGTLGIAGQVLGFLAPQGVLWPGGASVLNANYDGSWTFGFEAPSPQTFVEIWDGDFDYGDVNCNSLDTDDPNTPNTNSPFPFASPTALPEGVATGSGSILGSCPSIPDANTGLGLGNPNDDGSGNNFKRSPSYGANVVYKLVTPTGVEFQNLNASGNREWERFKVGTSGTDLDHPAVASLPSGLYTVRLEGMDAANQNFWYFNQLVGTSDCCLTPIEAFYTIDRFVFFDTDGDGVKQSEEFGIEGAVVSLVKEAAVSLIARSGTVATVTTGGAHGYLPGATVKISGAEESDYNGTFTIVAVPDTTTFTYTVSGSAPASASGTALLAAGDFARQATNAAGEFRFRVATGNYGVRVDLLPTLSITGIARVTSIATATTATPHGYVAGAKITIAGASLAGYNGAIKILSVPSPTTFTYGVSVSLVTPAVGTITATNVLNGLFKTTPESFSGLDMGPGSAPKSLHERRDFGFVIPAPAISLVKKTNGSDNNTAPGLGVTTGAGITWTYLITNTGNVPLTAVSLTDDILGPVLCPVITLAVGANMTCIKTGIAIAGQYTNIGTVVGTPPSGPPVTATDPDNYFGIAPASTVGTGDTATIGYWQNKNGQALIKKMNGASTSQTFANWLASSFPYLYGANSANNLTNKTNVDVAALFVKLFTSGESPKTSAQVMANAIAVYVTNTTLAGGSYAGSYGFNLSNTGTGAKVYNVGTSGTAIGLQNNTNYTVSQILAQANLTKAAGTFNTVAFNDICEGINSQGGIG